MSTCAMPSFFRAPARDGVPLACAALVLATGLFAPNRAGATDSRQDSPEAAARAAYTELSGLTWAPRSPARDEEIGQLVARDVDFEELTRRAFGEPCPRSACTDHWAEFSAAQRAEVEPLFAEVVTRQWTREVGKASGYDIEVQPAVVHSRDARVRIFVRPKGGPGKAPIVVDAFVLANHAPYRLVDVDVDGSRLARGYYKQFDRVLSTPGEGFAYLVSRLRKKVDRGSLVPEIDADSEAGRDDDVDAARAASEAKAPEPPRKPPARGWPWLPIALGGTAAVAIGAWLGRRERASRKARAHAKEEREP